MYASGASFSSFCSHKGEQTDKQVNKQETDCSCLQIQEKNEFNKTMKYYAE